VKSLLALREEELFQVRQSYVNQRDQYCTYYGFTGL
jgi:hypothetical protein